MNQNFRNWTSKNIKIIIDRVIFYGLAAIPLSILSFFGRFWWPFELMSHFRAQYFVLNFFLLVFALIRKKVIIAVISLFLLLVNGFLILELYKTVNFECKNVGTFVKALLFNMHSSNTKLKDVREFIKKENPDFVAILELTQAVDTDLSLKELGYRFELKQPREDNFGIALFSKYELKNSKILRFAKRTIPSISAEIEPYGIITRIIISHPVPPITPEYFRLRNTQLKDLSQFVAENLSFPTIVMMDMNATPWSFVFSDFEADSGLKSGVRGFGLLPSWPTWMPLLWIPLDHIFVSKSVKVKSMKRGPIIGSDHFPILINFGDCME